MARIAISELRIGDKVDLEGDAYADPNAGDGSDHPEFEFEYERVMHVERETPETTVVHFESGFSCGFPHDHEVEVEEPRPDAEPDAPKP